MDIINRDINLQRTQDIAVSLAAIAQDGWIIAVSHKMLSGKDNKSASMHPHIIPLTDSILLITAKDPTLQAEIIGDLKDYIATQENDHGFLVKEWADCYVTCLQAIQNKRITREIISPNGLTMETFLDKQKIMLKERFFLEIANQISHCRNMCNVSALIVGMDSKGSHIYRVNDHQVNCQSFLGFGAIGEGSPHAISDFMCAKQVIILLVL